MMQAHKLLRLVDSAVRLLCAQVSRDAPPPLPDGYKAGDKVLDTGANQAASTGEDWVIV